jgi:hypothetical protein
MDIGVDLIEAYLRINGYFTLTEFEVQRKVKNKGYETVTDVDVMGVRYPGHVHAADEHNPKRRKRLLVEDETLQLNLDEVDVIIGEVKQGKAVWNPGLTSHHTLHAVMSRVEWLYDDPVSNVVEQLAEKPVCVSNARGGGKIRTRLVAFGRSPVNDINTISLTHVFEFLVDYFERFDDVLKPAQLKAPSAALVRLLVKTGFSVRKPEDETD